MDHTEQGKKDPAPPRRMRVRFPIGAKLVSIITTLLLISLGAITVMVSVLVTNDIRVTAENNNFTVNTRSATEAEHILTETRSNMTMLLRILSILGAGARSETVTEAFFEEYPDIAAVAIFGGDSAPPVSGEGSAGDTRFINQEFFRRNEIDPSLVETFIRDTGVSGEAGTSKEVGASKEILLNAAPVFEIPLLVMLLPLIEDGEEKTAALFFSSDSLTEAFGTGVNASFMINRAGDILVHADHTLVRSGANLSGRPFIRDMHESGETSRRTLQTLFTGEDGKRYFGAYTRLSLAGAAVITNVEYDVVFEGIAATTRRNIFLTAGVLFLSILFVWFFSKTISGPLKNLSAAAAQIRDGRYEVELTTRNRDEIGLLTESFVEMSRGLAERERLKDTFGRFINKEIAEQAMKGELKLGGENKRVSIFFSDIRGFTALAEKFKPHDVVEFLNQYLTRMVDCVNQTGGVVDKFIGDAIMGVWGAPVSAGSPARDAMNCVRAALRMRRRLREYNKTRGSPRRPVIRIGCGINTGDVVAGQIGSSQRMEYTVIGDAVNLASRTESLNKPLHTDILITENTWRLVKDHIIAEEMPPVTVKGKEKPVRLFAVVNIRVRPGKVQPPPASLAELRQLLGLTAPDLGKVDMDEEEKKYKITTDE
ncbi:MAG: HAMP domain-containing protein [Treponema sp.]|jgi:adenylate cyclase|nr:HAMP domain-containing protein [Treponema sp.]